MDLSGAAVLVAGARVTGRAILAALTPLGARATLTDDSPSALTAFAQNGVAVIDPANAAEKIAEFDLVVTSPGLPPTAPVLVAAAAAGVPVWGDVELAWRLDNSGRYGPPRRWLVVTGTNGKTTTTSMLHAMLVAAGRRALLCGNIGDPVLDVLDQPAELLAVELSSFQLHWAPSLRPEAGVVLNVAEDHLDWHGTIDAYARDKARVLDGRVAVVGLDDPVAAGLLPTAAAPVRVGFRLGEPARGELGVRDGVLVDNAFGEQLALAETASIPVAGPVGVLDALAAAALARAVDVPPHAIAHALAALPGGQAPRRGDRHCRRRHVCRRLQGHQPARGTGVDHCIPAGGVDRRRSAEGRVGRRTGHCSGEPPGRSGFDRPRPHPDPRRVIATRPGCPHSRACDRGGFWGAWAN